MKSIKYTPDAADKLRDIKREVSKQYGKEKAKLVIDRLLKSIKSLLDNENKGPSAAKMFEIESEYRYLFVSPNYVFYRVEETCIRIVNIYHEKEDFMWQLFGIETTPQETIEYWEE